MKTLYSLLLVQLVLCQNAASAFGLKFELPSLRKPTATSSWSRRSSSSRQQQLPWLLRGGHINISEEEIIPEPYFDLPDAIIEPKFGVLFIDRFCHYHGGYLAAKAREVYGVATINALSTYVSGYMTMSAQQSRGSDSGNDEPPSHLKLNVPSPVELDQWKERVPFEIVGIICESDSGLDEAELLGEALHVLFHNGYNPARRDKFLMNNVAAEKGLRTVRQRMCASLEEAVDFATELGVSVGGGDDTNEKTQVSTNSNAKDGSESNGSELNAGQLGRASNKPSHLSNNGKYCVIKPTRGVASDDVYFCSNLDAVKGAFERIHGTSVFGSITGERHESVVSKVTWYDAKADPII